MMPPNKSLLPYPDIEFVRLSEITSNEVILHMNDPVVGRHMPLLTAKWDIQAFKDFVEAKEACWRRDGLGHWAILDDGNYVGWGGFQMEGDEWDFGLVLKPAHFGLGARITRKAIAFAKADARIRYFTFLLPPSRTRLGALARLGARPIGHAKINNASFRKFRLDTA